MSKPFTFSKFTPNYGYGHILTWGIDRDFEDPEPHNFIVQVSGTEDFSELLYEFNVGNSFTATDTTREKQDTSLSYYYRVKLITEKGQYYSRTMNFIGSSTNRREYIMAREIVRKELLRMKFTGSEAFLLKRKIFGKPLKDDPTVDPISGVPLTDEVAGHGNHFSVGYYKPLSFLLSIEDQRMIRQLAPDGTGVFGQEQFEMRAVGFPTIETNDIIVLPDNDHRVIVKEKTDYTFPGTDCVIVQTLTVLLLPTTDNVYKIKVK